MKKKFLITNEILLFIYLTMSLFIAFWKPKILIENYLLNYISNLSSCEARKIKHDDKIIETESFILLRSTQILITL